MLKLSHLDAVPWLQPEEYTLAERLSERGLVTIFFHPTDRRLAYPTPRGLDRRSDSGQQFVEHLVGGNRDGRAARASMALGVELGTAPCGAQLYAERLRCPCGASVADTADKMLDDLMAGVAPPKLDMDVAFHADQEKRRRREEREANRRRRGKAKGSRP